jgi:hypothetical protein
VVPDTAIVFVDNNDQVCASVPTTNMCIYYIHETRKCTRFHKQPICVNSAHPMISQIVHSLHTHVAVYNKYVHSTTCAFEFFETRKGFSFECEIIIMKRRFFDNL